MPISAFFSFFALLIAIFLFWRRSSEEHFDEFRLLDHFFSSLLLSLILARFTYILLHLTDFAGNFINWIDVFSQPGINFVVVAALWPLILFFLTRKEANNSIEILDFWAQAITGALPLFFLGWLLAGSHIGLPTGINFGWHFKGVFEARHPTQLYAALLYLLLFRFLWKSEYRYRTFSWYQQSRGTALSGFVFSSYLIFSGLIWLLLSFFKPAEIVINSFSLEPILALATLLTGAIFLLARSGLTKAKSKHQSNNFESTKTSKS